MKTDKEMKDWHDKECYEGESFYDFVARMVYDRCDFTEMWGVLGQEVIYGVTFEDIAYEFNGVGELLYCATMLRGAKDTEVEAEYDDRFRLIYKISRGDVVREFCDTDFFNAFQRAKRWIMKTPLMN